MVYPEMAVAEGASVVPLEVKLEELGGSDIADGWFCRAVSVLRGGDGGEHGHLLYKLVVGMLREVRPVVALDVGTARGFSALVMARAILSVDALGVVYSVDTLGHEENVGWHGGKNDADDPLARLTVSRSRIWERWFVSEQRLVVPVQGRSVGILRNWEYGKIDVAFLDGSHAYEDVGQELSLLDDLLADTGVVVLDDYHLGEVVGRVRSRLLNVAARLMGRMFGKWSSRVRSFAPRLGESNEYRLIKQRFVGVRAAVDEFVSKRSGRWSLEIVRMPRRADYQGGDYSVAILSRRRIGGRDGSERSREKVG